MPRIKLKPNSPEFADKDHKGKAHSCEMPGCNAPAPHKAPKNRALSDYFYFCMDHIREYNKAWNFFSGMSDHEVEDHMIRSMYGDRPTWRFDNAGAAEDILKRKAWQTYNFTDKEPPKDSGFGSHKTGHNGHGQTHGIDRHSAEFKAMAIMGLEPPVTLKAIRKRYKSLAKQHHPDLNKGCAKSEELLKEINMAYTILKVAYEEYEKLPDKN